MVETGPDPAIDGVVRWRRFDLQRLVEERFGVADHERTIGKLLDALGFSHISARPRHPKQDGEVVEAFKKLPAHAWLSPRGRDAQEEDRDLVPGQSPHRPEEWPREAVGAPRKRPIKPADQRHESAYLFGAICPARGVGAALALPFADTDAMQHHINEIALNFAPGAHAVGMVDAAAAALFSAGIVARLDGWVLWCLTTPDLFAPALAQAGLDPDRVIYVEAGSNDAVLACFEEGLRHGGLVAVVAEVAR